MLLCDYETVTLKEVPGEISLSYSIKGCRRGCKNCSWKGISSPAFPLDVEKISADIKKFKGLITCVLFLGGEWDISSLLPLLSAVKKADIKTCMYTGAEYKEVDQSVLKLLDYIKVGPYIEEKGGLDNPETNQKFLNLCTGEDITYRFQRQFKA
jgi:anaerobic ribonucleoside-triphosphate reductase activating protein